MNEKLKKIIQEIVKEVVEEISTTGNVAGYATPHAFSGNGKVNRKRIENNSAGYTLVKETSDSVVVEGYRGFKKHPMRNEAKISLSLQEVNKILRQVEYLVGMNKKLKTETNTTTPAWKRSAMDVVKINERIKSIARGIREISRGVVIQEAVADIPGQQPKISTGTSDVQLNTIMDTFENQIGAVVSKTEEMIKKKLLGKTVTLKASKGYGQVEKDYTFSVASVSIGLFKEKYILILKGTDNKEYYIDPKYKAKVKSSQNAKIPRTAPVSKNVVNQQPNNPQILPK